MEKTSKEMLDMTVLENSSKWQVDKEPLAILTDAQLELLYHIQDSVKTEYFDENNTDGSAEESHAMNGIDTQRECIEWLTSLEKDMLRDAFESYVLYYEVISRQTQDCSGLLKIAEQTVAALDQLRMKYRHVTSKTDSLHNLSEQLMREQMQLKDVKVDLKEKLHYFIMYNSLKDCVGHVAKNVQNREVLDILDNLDRGIEYFTSHFNYKESQVYKMKYESLLSNALSHVGEYINSVIIDTTKQVTDPESNINLLSLENPSTDTSVDTAFALYYGKFQSASFKVREIISSIEDKSDFHQNYRTVLFECQRTYFSQRFPVMAGAVTKALNELKTQHKSDHSVLFRSSCLFIMKVCQDESNCFFYFFKKHSSQLDEYLGHLCQNLYDHLRPNLIAINHLEILTELCGILRKEMLNDSFLTNDSLRRFVDVVKQMLQDVEERLVFRANVFFQHDLSSYKPSPGDLAYPEKLKQMENIAFELKDARSDSRSSSASQELPVHLAPNQLGQFRSYTGNSPADLHGMWYPTVKRTLVCLSRLYFCLDREIFQSLAQEALAVCVQTIDAASKRISASKSPLDGKLFQIKHLLILREQIAPFQVDFTVKEVGLDFSHVKTAALELIHNRGKLFTFSSNNALLEFLLDGTPRVKEYLVDSRKEIDKQLKLTCEEFIQYATELLVGSLLSWLLKAESALKADTERVVALEKQEFAQPHVVGNIISSVQRDIKTKTIEIQKSMQLYLANRETEFILFRPIKNNIINAFQKLEQLLLDAKYSNESLLRIGCPSAEQVNVLICSVSLALEQDTFSQTSQSRKELPNPSEDKDVADTSNIRQ